jgi:hypothetical protein
MNFSSLLDSSLLDHFCGIIVECDWFSKTAPSVFAPSSLSRLNSPAIPTAPHDFAMVFRRLLEPSDGDNHSKQQ